MWTSIKYLLFKLKLLQLSERDFFHFIKNDEMGKVEFALKYGNYKTRKLAAETLEIIGDESSVPFLLDAINDKIQIVSIAALNALEAVNFDDKFSVAIIKKRFEWVKRLRDSQKKFEESKGRKFGIYRWERTSKKNFEMVKERLKKPIR